MCDMINGESPGGDHRLSYGAVVANHELLHIHDPFRRRELDCTRLVQRATRLPGEHPKWNRTAGPPMPTQPGGGWQREPMPERSGLVQVE